MSNPWAEVYKDFRSEVLNEEDLQERRRLQDVKTAARQGKYDLKSRVAKMKAQGKTDLEIKQWLDNYLRNSQLPGEQKAQMRQSALNAGYEFEGDQLDEIAPIVAAPLVIGGAVAAYKGLQHLKKKGDEALNKTRSQYAGAREKQVQDILKQSYQPEGEDVQEVAPPGAKYERMVKHIKDKYSKGGLTQKEKSIAYATAWKAKNQANEEFVVEESERVLVRITTEDGRVFEKKVPKDKIPELRKRYKSVVEVGSSERKPEMTSKQDNVKEAKRWWDDDGDGIGYEPGEVSGKFKKKKKKVKEGYSDWRDEMQLDENQLGLSPAEMRAGAVEKKNEDSWESESELSECNDFGTWTESDQELVNLLAEELGGDLLEIEVLDERKIPKVDIKQAQRVISQLKDKIDDLVDIKPYEKGGEIVKYQPPKSITKAAEKPLTPLERAEVERLRSTSIKDRPTGSVRLSTGRQIADIQNVSIDTKTGAIVRVEPKTVLAPRTQTQTKSVTRTAVPTLSQSRTQPQTQTQTQPQTSIPTPPPPTRFGPPGGPIGGIPGGGQLPRLPKLGIALGEPKNVGKIAKV